MSHKFKMERPAVSEYSAVRVRPAAKTRSCRKRQRGASLVEFGIVAIPLLLTGLGTVQAGLVYHAKTTLNYATFEAARTGATRHALPGPMRAELGARLAPLIGGDGSTEKAATAIARSMAEIDMPVSVDGRLAPVTRLSILNPTLAAFDAWGQESLEHENRFAIPNSHLRFRADVPSPGDAGITLRDANLLKIEVTHAFPLDVPFVGTVLATALAALDPANAYYAARTIPLTSVATVHMQSEAWRSAVVEANAELVTTSAPDGEAEPTDASVPQDGDSSDGSAGEDPASEGDVGEDGISDTDDDTRDECGADGLPLDTLLSATDYADGTCSVADTGYDSPGSGIFDNDDGAGDVSRDSSPLC